MEFTESDVEECARGILQIAFLPSMEVRQTTKDKINDAKKLCKDFEKLYPDKAELYQKCLEYIEENYQIP
jgi:hypothetical protein